MNFEEYRKLTGQFVKYPKEKELEYLVLGLVSEYFEYMDISPLATENEGIKELGDCFWYVSQLSNLFDIVLFSGCEVKVTNVFKYLGLLSGAVKKYIRGDYQVDVLKEKIQEILPWIQSWILEEVCSYDLDLSEILQFNIDKLTDRKKRNVIKGDGDNR